MKYQNLDISDSRFVGSISHSTDRHDNVELTWGSELTRTRQWYCRGVKRLPSILDAACYCIKSDLLLKAGGIPGSSLFWGPPFQTRILQARPVITVMMPSWFSLRFRWFPPLPLVSRRKLVMLFNYMCFHHLKRIYTSYMSGLLCIRWCQLET